ncbi:hypothetical protein J2794_005230 [Paraburkholderia terricola]|uniref:hypothetical protein n=1 Tax=Paraburkholderia terricola TaxID=169427 RepID=UPI0028549007|nr:hypothetical protein [Paraburkholderia terricola]MDR6449098.1 hypothetical protein [Paraburkholderia terricola]
MATQAQKPAEPNEPDKPGRASPDVETGQPGRASPDEEAGEPGTFKTDVSETDDEGTSVREAEVRDDDLSETGSPESDEEA